MAPIAVDSDKGLIEPRFVAVLSDAGSEEATMDAFEKAAVVSVAIMNCIARTKDNSEVFVETTCSLPPTELADMSEVAKVTSSYVVSETTTLVEAKVIAERAAQSCLR